MMFRVILILVFRLRTVCSANEDNCIIEMPETNLLQPETVETGASKLEQATNSSNSNDAHTSTSGEKASSTPENQDWMFIFDGDIDKYFDKTTKENQLVIKMCKFWKCKKENSRVLNYEFCSAMKKFCFDLNLNVQCLNLNPDPRLKKLFLSTRLKCDASTPSLLFDHTIHCLAFAYNLFMNYKITIQHQSCGQDPLKHDSDYEREIILSLMTQKLETLSHFLAGLKTARDSISLPSESVKNQQLVSNAGISIIELQIAKIIVEYFKLKNSSVNLNNK